MPSAQTYIAEWTGAVGVVGACQGVLADMPSLVLIEMLDALMF